MNNLLLCTLKKIKISNWMKMKNYLKVLSSVVLLAFLGSCSSEDGKESVSGQGSIMVDLSTNLSYSRAVDESAYLNVNNYKVSLYKGEEPVYTDQLYGDLDVEQKVDFGVSYTLTAYYGEDVAAGYDKLYVKGSQTFTVSQGDKKTVSILCKPANARITLVYKGNDDNDAFEDYFQDCTVTVKTDYMDEAWTMNKSNEGQQLYLKTGDEGTNATLSFSLIDKNGEPVSVDGFDTSKVIDLKPCYSYTLTIKPNKTNIAGGKLGLTITVDDGVTDEDVTVNIPGDYIPN